MAKAGEQPKDEEENDAPVGPERDGEDDEQVQDVVVEEDV